MRQMAGVLKVRSPTTSKLSTSAAWRTASRWSQRCVAIWAHGFGSAIYSEVVNTFHDAPAKPFLLMYNATAYAGTCVLF